MAVPDYQTFMLPLLRLVASEPGREWAMKDCLPRLGAEFQLTEDELREMLPSGGSTKFSNRVNWARTYLKKAGLLQSPRRAFIQITDRGLSVLSDQPEFIGIEFLRQFEEFREFQSRRNSSSEEPEQQVLQVESETTPLEAMDSGYRQLRAQLADELLDQVKSCSPEFFERLVVELLVRMGYGGSLVDAGKAVGRSGDGGIDGIIKEDKLGLDVIYIQAKRWDSNSIGRPQIQQFAGALHGQHAGKGIFLTTSKFTSEARDFVKGIGSRIVLIDGVELAELMIDHDIGCNTASVYSVKRLDSDYFTEGE
jgi:restriction system protein